MSRIHTVHLIPLTDKQTRTIPFPVYTCYLCDAYDSFTKGCTNCDSEKLLFEQEAMQQLYLDAMDDNRMDYMDEMGLDDGE